MNLWSLISDGPLTLILEYAPHGSLKHFLDECRLSVSSAKHHPTHVLLHSSSSTASSSYPLLRSSMSSGPHTPVMWEKPPLSAQTSVFSTHSYVALAGLTESPTTLNGDLPRGLGCADDVFSEDSPASASGVLSLVHRIRPVTHDYIKCPKKLAGEDIRNFALQIASGLSHLAEMKVCLVAQKTKTLYTFSVTSVSEWQDHLFTG